MATKTNLGSTHRISEKLEDLIRSRGWAVVTVSGRPGFSYSVGLAERDLPEIVVFGVGAEEGPKIIGDSARTALDGGRLNMNEPLHGLLNNFKAVLRSLAPDEIQLYLKAAWVRSSGKMDAVQLVWPDPKGKFHWEAGFDEKFLHYQPLLGSDPLKLPTS
jgi:hypothetical protein